MAEENDRFETLDRRRLLQGTVGSLIGLGAASGRAGAVTVVDNGSDSHPEWNIDVFVTVEDLDGDPIEGVKVELEDRGGTPDDRFARTDTDGKIHFIENVGPPPTNCQRLLLHLPEPEETVDLGCRNGGTSVSHTFQIDRDRVPETPGIPPETDQLITDKDDLITSIRSFARAGLPDDAPQLDQRAQILVNRIEREYPDATDTKQQQFDLALERMIEAERVTEASVSEPKQFVDTVADKFLDMVLGTIGLAALSVGSVEGRVTGSTEAALGGDAIETELNALSMLQGIVASGLPTAETERKAKNDFERLRNENRETLLEAGEAALVEGVEAGIDTITQEIKDQAESIAQESEDSVAERIYEVYLFVEGLGTIGGIGDHPGIDPLLEREMRELEEAVSNNELQQDNKNRSDIRNEKNTRTRNLTKSANSKIDKSLISVSKFAISLSSYAIFLNSLRLAATTGGVSAPLASLTGLANIGASQAYAQLSIAQIAYGGWTLNELQGVHENAVTKIN